MEQVHPGKCNDVLDRDVVELLQAALDRTPSKKGPVKVHVLLNDTAGTLSASIYKHHQLPPNRIIGVIIGTGTNAAYVEQTANVLKLGEDTLGAIRDPLMIINTEWGALGDRTLSHSILHSACSESALSILGWTEWDEACDQGTPNRGKQHFEKMVSGLQMGNLLARIYQHLSGQDINALAGQAADAKTCSEVEEGTSDLLQRVADPGLLQKIARWISDRSADLASSIIFSLVEYLVAGGGDPAPSLIIVAIDGSIYGKYHNYKARLRALIDKKLVGRSIAIQLVDAHDLSSVGAAAGVASLC